MGYIFRLCNNDARVMFYYLFGDKPSMSLPISIHKVYTFSKNNDDSAIILKK